MTANRMRPNSVQTLIRKFAIKSLVVLAILMARPVLAVDVASGVPALDPAFEALLDDNFSRKGEGIEALAASGHPKAAQLLSGVLEGDIQIDKKTGRVVFAERADSGYHIRDAITGEDLGETSRRGVRKIGINNAVRSQIQAALAKLDIDSSDPARRLAAVQQMLERPAPANAEVLRTRVDAEQDAGVREAMRTAIALSDLGDEDPAHRLKAVAAVSGSLEPTIRNALTRVAQDDPDEAVKAAAQHALAAIEREVSYYGFIETLFFGLSAGSVLVLAAIGLAITFGVMGVINMAHGELIMLGAYTTYLMQQALPGMPGLAVALSIPAAFLVSGFVGILIERGVIRFLYGRPLETLLATFGISLALQQLVRTVISPQNVPVENPEYLSGFWQINSVLSLTYNRLYIIGFCLIVFAALFITLKKTRLGLQVRAVSQNRAMARAMGVRSARVDALTFGLGSGIAGIAGVALSQLTNVGPNLGQAYIVDSFMVVVFGGVGNLWGTLIGGMTLGVANKFMEPYAGAVLAKILVLVFIIVFIQRRPRGLFALSGRSVDA